MADYKITCGSTCDLTLEHLTQLGVNFVKYHYIIDGVEYLDDLYTSRSAKDFYDAIDGGAMPTTAQITPDELMDLFEPILQEGFDILHIEFSSGLSGSYRSALSAQEQMQKKYPDRKILVVDSLAASSGYGLLVDKAACLKQEGKNIDEVFAWLEENKLRLRHWFYTGNLAHFRRGGRVSGASAVIGSILGICPVMDVNGEGKLIVRKKVIGKRKTAHEMLRLMQNQVENDIDYGEKCYMSHSRNFEEAQSLANMVEGYFPNLSGKVEINDIGAVIGSHTGPGTVALFFFSKEKRTAENDAK